MSPESKANAATNEGQAVERDGVLRANDAPARRLALGEKGSGLLAEERATAQPPSLAYVCSWVAVASAAAFVACGLWQAGAIIGHARAIAQEVVAARAAIPSNRGPRASSEVAARPLPAAADPVPQLRRGDAGAPLRPEKTLVGSADPVLTLAANTTKAGATAAAFEAQAEAPERAVPIGLEPTLDDASSELRLGYPPPAELPRVRCAEIFVYIVTIAEEAPERSAASIGVGKKGPARFRRPGDAIGDWTVVAISDDWTGLNPDVWLEKDGTVCRAELAGNPSRVHQRPKPAPRRKARRRR